jgi:uncharacterized protein (DUF608 family)
LFQQDSDAVTHLYENYFNEAEKKVIMDINNRMSKEGIQEWNKIIHEVRECVDKDPGSETAQRLAERWMEQVHVMFGKDESFLQKMWEAIHDHKDGIAFYPMDKDVVNFIDRAVAIMYERQGQND